MPTGTSSVAFGSPAIPADPTPTHDLDKLDGILPVYLCRTGKAGRGELIEVLDMLGATRTGNALIREMQILAQAGAISTVVWHAAGDAPLPPRCWYYRRDGDAYEHHMTLQTDLRRHAALIFPGLVHARNTLVASQGPGGPPLDAAAMASALHKELARLRERDAPPHHYDGRLTAYVARDMAGNAGVVMRALQAISWLPEGHALLNELALLHKHFQVMPLIDAGPRDVPGRREPDGVPIWDPTHAGDTATILAQLADVRDALVSATPAVSPRTVNAQQVRQVLAALRLDADARIPVSRDDLDGLLDVDITQAGTAVRADIVGDLRRMAGTGIGQWLLKELRNHAKVGHTVSIHSGPCGGTSLLNGAPTWIHDREGAKERGGDAGLPPGTEGAWAAFYDLLTLRNTMAMRTAPVSAPLPVLPLTRLFRIELLDGGPELPADPQAPGVSRTPADITRMV